VTLYLLDTTVVIDHLRDKPGLRDWALRTLQHRHQLAVSAITIAEVVRGTRPDEQRSTSMLLDRLKFLATTREAAWRAGTYQGELAAQGITLHTADALIAGTARAHGAALITDNIRDFPLPDLKVIRPDAL
jgi:predicted nucleic acid-binding protein